MIRYFTEQLSVIPKTWNWFWFDSRSNDALSVLSFFRICFSLVMLFCYVSRAFDVDFFYSEQGLLPSWHIANVEFFKYHPNILGGISSSLVLNGLHSVFLLLLVLLALGFATRIVAPLTYFLHMMFINRNMSVMFGVDMIATFYFLYLCFANSGAQFSLDKKIGWSNPKQSPLSHISWRLMQVQLCVIYGFSGLEKLKGTRWWDGSAIWDVLSMGNMQRWDLSFVAHAPVLLAANVYVVLFWEIYFPILVWVPKLRPLVLAFGVLMHLGIFLFMNLPSFGFLMISLYILFLNKAEIEKILAARLPGITTKHS